MVCVTFINPFDVSVGGKRLLGSTFKKPERNFGGWSYLAINRFPDVCK